MKNKKIEKILIFVLLLAIIIPDFTFAQAKSSSLDKKAVICFGENLTNKQKDEVLKIFNINNDEDVKTIKVTNEEEREYLGKYIDLEKIGTKAISSVYIEELGEGEGIIVNSHNITWVTDDMYKNALITAGINDAKIIVASPFEVSGTSALTGIMKAFEDISDEKIDNEVKDLANQEIAVMGELKDNIGDKKTIELIITLKKEVLKKGYEFSNDIEELVREIAKELEIELTNEEVDMIVDFLIKFSRTDIDKKSVLKNIKMLAKENEISFNIFDKIKSFFKGLFLKIFS